MMRPFLHLLLAAACAPILVSCLSQEAIDRRIDKSKATYYEKQDRRKIRSYQRDARHEEWFDRVFD